MKVKEFFKKLPIISHVLGAKDYLLSKRLKYLRSLLVVRDVAGMNYVRFGRDYDGGYVMADCFDDSSIAYSFGICNDVSWELDAAKRGLDVFMYDHTIKKLPQENAKFHYFKLGISGVSGMKDLRTMEEFIKMNGHSDRTDIILKMDVEGAEWGFLNNAEEKALSQFSQIAIEFHGLERSRNFKLASSALKKLNKTHQLVHVHGNNGTLPKGLSVVVLPSCIEATYLRKTNHEFVDSTRVFPTELDMPNNPDLDDIFL